MNKLSLYVFIQFTFLLSISSVNATMWANISTKELIQKSDVILIGTVSEATNYYSSMPTNVEPDMKYIRNQGRFQTIRVNKILYMPGPDFISSKSTSYVYTFETASYGLDISPNLHKDIIYLMFLVFDTTINNKTIIQEKGLPTGLYVWPAYSASMSLIPIQSREYKNTLMEIEKVIGPSSKFETTGNN